MNGAHHQPVVALAVAVVEVDPQKPRVAGNQVGGVGWHLVGVKDMGEVQRNAEVLSVHLLDRQQGRSDIRHQREGTGLVGLVFDGNVDRAIVVRNLGDGFGAGVPHRPIVALEGVVEPVLAHPQGHQAPAYFGQRVEAALGQVDSRPTHLGVGIGKGADRKARIGVLAHSELIETHAVIGKDCGQLGRRMGLKMVRIVEVGRIEPTHPSGGGDQVGDIWASRQTRCRLEGVQPRRVA